MTMTGNSLAAHTITVSSMVQAARDALYFSSTISISADMLASGLHLSSLQVASFFPSEKFTWDFLKLSLWAFTCSWRSVTQVSSRVSCTVHYSCCAISTFFHCTRAFINVAAPLFSFAIQCLLFRLIASYPLLLLLIFPLHLLLVLGISFNKWYKFYNIIQTYSLKDSHAWFTIPISRCNRGGKKFFGPKQL